MLNAIFAKRIPLKLQSLIPIAPLLGIALGMPLAAQQPTAYATGLSNPGKVVPGPSGTLLVTENGNTANSGRISIIAAGGARRDLIDGLPSGLSAPNNEPDGANALLLNGNTLYLAVGERETFVNGMKQRPRW